MEKEFGRIIGEVESNKLIPPSRIDDFLFRYREILKQPEEMQKLLDEVDEEIEEYYEKQKMSSRPNQLKALKNLMLIKKKLIELYGSVDNAALINITNPQ